MEEYEGYIRVTIGGSAEVCFAHKTFVTATTIYLTEDYASTIDKAVRKLAHFATLTPEGRCYE